MFEGTFFPVDLKRDSREKDYLQLDAFMFHVEIEYTGKYSSLNNNLK